jgi:hypothetical protein
VIRPLFTCTFCGERERERERERREKRREEREAVNCVCGDEDDKNGQLKITHHSLMGQAE